jgi:anti-sigma B factor antagonist
MDFKVSSATLDGSGALLVSVDGELDIATAEELAKPLRVAVSDECPTVIDLCRCPFIDSNGLRLVLRTHHALAEVGQAVAVATAQPEVRKLFSLTAIDLSIPVFADRDKAIAWLGADGAKEASRRQPLPAASNGGAIRSSFPQ